MPNEEPNKLNEDLLKNLEEDLKKFGADSHKLIQDFVPYNESVIWDFSDSYYKSKGIMAWSNNASKIVPHKIGTNYQNALAFAKLVKENLEQFPSSERIQVLEAGAGSARFSRHFLLALKELEIQDKVQLIISDYSSCNLDSIKAAGILEGFIEGEDYKFQCVDITKTECNAVDRVLQTGSKPRAIFMHYVLDALPLTILRKNENIEELLISSSIRKEQEVNVLENEFLQSRTEHEDKWQLYTPNSELEKKYWEFFSDYHSDSFNRELYYSYTALEAISNLVDSLEENGFLLNIDVIPGSERRYIVVGNSIAHEVDNDLLASFAGTSNNKAFVKDGRSISRLVITKN